jgi:hypothetical protein
MKVLQIEDYVIYDSDGHGKASKGAKKTTGMQVRQPIGDGYLLLKTVNYPVGDLVKRTMAIEKCKEYIKTMI